MANKLTWAETRDSGSGGGEDGFPGSTLHSVPSGSLYMRSHCETSVTTLSPKQSQPSRDSKVDWNCRKF